MVHSLRIINYGLGHPSSVHDAYAFLGSCIVQNLEGIIPAKHWLWADSAY